MGLAGPEVAFFYSEIGLAKILFNCTANPKSDQANRISGSILNWDAALFRTRSDGSIVDLNLGPLTGMSQL